MKVEEQIAIIYCGVKGLLNDVSVDKIKQFEEELISFMNKNHSQTLQDLKAGKLTEEITSSIEAALKEVLKNF